MLQPGESMEMVSEAMLDREWLSIRVPVCEAHRDAERWPEWVHGQADALLRARGVVMPREVVEELVVSVGTGALVVVPHLGSIERVH